MLASKPDPVHSVENPVALIRSRIREKRLFEARFLCRQLGDALGVREKAAIENELAGPLRQVETLQQEARRFFAEGHKERAVGLYRDIEALAIDVPGLADEKRTLAGAEEIIARLTYKTMESTPPILSATPIPIINDSPPVGPLFEEQPKKRRVAIWLAVCLLAASLLLLLVWRGGQHEPLFAPPLAQPVQKILIRPLVPALSPEQSVEEKAPPPPPAETTPPYSPSLKLSSLQIKEAEHR